MLRKGMKAMMERSNLKKTKILHLEDSSEDENKWKVVEKETGYV